MPFKTIWRKGRIVEDEWPDSPLRRIFRGSELPEGCFARRRPAPTHPFPQRLPYSDEEVPEILPKFWTDVSEVRIFLVARDSPGENELFLPPPHDRSRWEITRPYDSN